MTFTTPAALHIELLSDSTFSRGEGTAGIVDTEIEHDAYGLPFIGGKAVRGLLRDSWLSMYKHFPELQHAAERVLGRSKALLDESCRESCRLRIGDALLPEAIRSTVRAAHERKSYPLPREAVLAGFTDIRNQTAEDRTTGTPETTTLRSSRVVLRTFIFVSRLSWLDGYEPNTEDLRLLAICSLTTRHGGLARNRGRGHIRLTLDGDIDRTKRLAEGKT